MFDFDTFQSRLESEVVRVYRDLRRREKIYSIALYTDQGGMTICMSANTEDYFLNMIKKEPNEACYYRWVPDAWKYSYIDSSELDYLSANLANCVLRDDCYDDFDLFMDRLIEKSILSLKCLRDVAPEIGETILLFTISDSDDKQQKLKWIRELNSECVVKEYVRCIDEL